MKTNIFIPAITIGLENVPLLRNSLSTIAFTQSALQCVPAINPPSTRSPTDKGVNYLRERRLIGRDLWLDVLFKGTSTLPYRLFMPLHISPNVLGDSERVREPIFSVCSAVLEALGTVRTVSGPIQHAESESAGVWGVWSLIGCVLLARNQRISAVCGRGGPAPRD